MTTRRYFSETYACFSCRKAFARTRRLISHKLNPPVREQGRLVRWAYFPQLTATCPHCRGALYLMGTNFKAPPRHKEKVWGVWRQDAGERYLYWMKRAASRSDPDLTARIDPYFSGKKA
jgi:hypothetical protein